MVYIYTHIYVYVCVYIYVYIYTMEYYSTIKRNEFESVELRCMNLRPLTKSEVRKRKTNIVY